jgi:hypothetical protein
MSASLQEIPCDEVSAFMVQDDDPFNKLAMIIGCVIGALFASVVITMFHIYIKIRDEAEVESPLSSGNGEYGDNSIAHETITRTCKSQRT